MDGVERHEPEQVAHRSSVDLAVGIDACQWTVSVGGTFSSMNSFGCGSTISTEGATV
jgi:hypothetical protein